MEKRKQFGIDISMTVETDMDVLDFTEKFVQWVEENGWSCGGGMRAVDEDGIFIEEEV